MNLHLEYIDNHNASDLVQPAELPGAGFYTIPRDFEAANEVLKGAVERRENNTGDVLLGYDLDQDNLFVGSGNVWHLNGEISFGYWVVSALRHQGYGRALRIELDHRAMKMFKNANSMVAHIHFRNVSSIAIADSLGYEETGTASYGAFAEYRKQLWPT